MKKNKKIIFYCIDNNVKELDHFRENFKPNYNYTLYTFDSVQHFFNELENDAKKDKSLKIVFIDNLITSKGMNTKTALELIAPLKIICKDLAIVIFADRDNFDLNATATDIRPSAFIKRDSQLFIRIYPLISRLISEYEVKIKKRSLRKTSFIILLLFLIMSIAFVIGLLIYNKFLYASP